MRRPADFCLRVFVMEKKTTPGGAVNNVTESVGKTAAAVGVVSIFNYNTSDRFAARNNDYR